jgi:cytochrome c2
LHRALCRYFLTDAGIVVLEIPSIEDRTASSQRFLFSLAIADSIMFKIKFPRHSQNTLLAILLATVLAVVALGTSAESPKPDKDANTTVSGDAAVGEEQFEAVCSECHGPAATAPTLRGIIGRPIASVESFYGYSEALKAKKSQTWTAATLDIYLKSPAAFAPGNFMYREFPDAKMRADVIAYLATLPPPR